MDDQQRKKLFVNVFERNINDRYHGNPKSKQNTKNNLISQQLSDSAKSSDSKIHIEENEDYIVPNEKDQQGIQIKHQDTKNLTSVQNLLLRHQTESTPANYNPSPLQNFYPKIEDQDSLKQINLN
ncbi:hypothetical protein TTHERM_000597629 (macronuclear) [Tetrahymena thermophila SB210]|uniref:Uncharacterized protein n=1 Tax=Tetrahymena thermophila (strain SB210) TaxID=312017 RepID=W7XL33_TETTS|nr:hypothetical protein TTHERM_000597629 [Tetrahymena thermophila SB210]EWS75589.1 hypothetical protein TTHERM_000597629 [Tetrahymena thermophila SB210]|eukprot:XP_012651889.1 hypothetical protein TTHERM_000597629 [Tetrahymena thermophila SB210]